MSEEKPKTEFKRPRHVRCQPQQDGGALVSANIGYQTVFSRAFSDIDEARTIAAGLFNKSFEVSVEECDETPF